MNFTEVTPENDEKWLELRTKVLTASDMGVILGLNKWKSVKELIEQKENFVAFENAYTWLGQIMEPLVVECVNKTLGVSFTLFDEKGTRSFFVDQELGLGATPDADNGEVLLECKSTKPGNWLRWAHWPPSYYLAQLYTQMMCVGRETGYLAILSTNLTQQSEKLNIPLHVFKIERDPKIDQIFVQETERFWQCRAENKMYRVNRKQTELLEFMFRFNVRKIHGE